MQTLPAARQVPPQGLPGMPGHPARWKANSHADTRRSRSSWLIRRPVERVGGLLPFMRASGAGPDLRHCAGNQCLSRSNPQMPRRKPGSHVNSHGPGGAGVRGRRKSQRSRCPDTPFPCRRLTLLDRTVFHRWARDTVWPTTFPQRPARPPGKRRQAPHRIRRRSQYPTAGIPRAGMDAVQGRTKLPFRKTVR